MNGDRRDTHQLAEPDSATPWHVRRPNSWTVPVRGAGQATAEVKHKSALPSCQKLIKQSSSNAAAHQHQQPKTHSDPTTCLGARLFGRLEGRLRVCLHPLQLGV